MSLLLKTIRRMGNVYRPRAGLWDDERMISPASDSPYAAELALAETAVLGVGDLLRRMAAGGVRYGYKPSRTPGGELVSEADMAVDAAVREAILSAYPQDGWLSEEHPDDGGRLERRRVWILDPVDGTREFLQGLPEYSVSLALTVDGAPVLGVVYNPARDELFSAMVEGTVVDGTARSTDGHRVAGGGPMSAQRTLDGAVMLAGRGQMQAFPHFQIPGVEVRGVGSIAYRLALVSAGRGDFTFVPTTRKEWDLAAGAALVLAAGGVITDVRGRPLRFNQPNTDVQGVTAANRWLHPQLLTRRDHSRHDHSWPQRGGQLWTPPRFS